MPYAVQDCAYGIATPGALQTKFATARYSVSGDA